MSQVETLPAINTLDFSLTSEATHIHENWSASLDSHVLSCPRNPSCEPFAAAGEVIFADLPPLHRGHPDIHLRNGIMNSTRSSDEHIPDSEKAFFVADLSQVYHQYQRWKANLPEIQPFYGMFAVVFLCDTH